MGPLKNEEFKHFLSISGHCIKIQHFWGIAQGGGGEVIQKRIFSPFLSIFIPLYFE
jgi:hypothetical protein